MGEDLTVEEAFPGIYYVKGKVLFDTQFVVTSCLKGDSHKSLRLLSTNVRKEDAREFIKDAIFLSDPGDRNNMEAVLRVSIEANQKIYNEIRRQSKMSDSLKDFFREFFKEELEEQKREVWEKK